MSLDIGRIYSIESLEEQGLVADVVSAIQKIRKKTSMNIKDTPGCSISTTANLALLMKQYSTHIIRSCNLSYLNTIGTQDNSCLVITLYN